MKKERCVKLDLVTRIQQYLEHLYGTETGQDYVPRFRTLAESYRSRIGPAEGRRRISEKDVMLITYPDQVQDGRRPHLRVLSRFAQEHLAGTVNSVHLLPFFPYSSDDGFSVMDFLNIAPGLGGWEEVEKLSRNYHVMFDFVCNHVSAQGRWFREYLSGNPEYREFFIECDPDEDLSSVVRPRTSPLLTRFDSAEGEKWIWTTFSADQVDLNYGNPEVLLRMTDILLSFAEHGARYIRMDAVAYLWKEKGTSCIHLPRAHTVVKLFRAVLDCAAPGVSLITETNVPHRENIQYFGNGHDEAQLVYQFSLPPLTAHALLANSSTRLSEWASALEMPSDEATFFNFTASHDGVGVRPAENILSESEIGYLAECAQKHGGYVSYRTRSDGSESPYELNINYLSLLSRPEEDWTRGADRFLVSQGIMLCMPGMPGIYFHSLAGSVNYNKGVEKTGEFRSINREKCDYTRLSRDLSQPPRSYIYSRYTAMIRARIEEPAFGPYCPFEILDQGKQVFGLRRRSQCDTHRVTALFSLCEDTLPVQVAFSGDTGSSVKDIISGNEYPVSEQGTLAIELGPFEMLWLKQ